MLIPKRKKSNCDTTNWTPTRFRGMGEGFDGFRFQVLGFGFHPKRQSLDIYDTSYLKHCFVQATVHLARE